MDDYLDLRLMIMICLSIHSSRSQKMDVDSSLTLRLIFITPFSSQTIMISVPDMSVAGWI